MILDELFQLVEDQLPEDATEEEIEIACINQYTKQIDEATP
jgi:hypothetical protein